MWPPWTTAQVWAKLRNRAVLEELGVDADLVDAWLAEPTATAGSSTKCGRGSRACPPPTAT